jgi:hypothetical protein
MGIIKPVESNAADTRHFSINSRVMVAKKADAGPSLCKKRVQTSRFADVTRTPTMPLEADPRRRIMRQHDVHVADEPESLNLVCGVVSLRIVLELARAPQIIRRTIAATDASHANCAPFPISDVDRTSVT